MPAVFTGGWDRRDDTSYRFMKFFNFEGFYDMIEVNNKSFMTGFKRSFIKNSIKHWRQKSCHPFDGFLWMIFPWVFRQRWNFEYVNSKKTTIIRAEDKLTTAANMIILLFASRRFSVVHEKNEFALNSLNFRWCFLFCCA